MRIAQIVTWGRQSQSKHQPVEDPHNPFRFTSQNPHCITRVEQTLPPLLTMNRHLALRTSGLARTAPRIPTQLPLLRPLSSSALVRSPPLGDKPSLVKSFLYGSEKGQELQREMEQSYSKVLARGKYVHKMNQHHVKPDKIKEYIALMYPTPPTLWCAGGLTVARIYSRKLRMIPRTRSTWLAHGEPPSVPSIHSPTSGSTAGIRGTT